MKQLNQNELDRVFIDVRKAYRLLYFYQRRVLDTIKFISDNLSIGVTHGWSCLSGNAPKNGSRINLNSWAWDWLNFYIYEFNFQEKEINKNKYQFAIAVQSDSGCDEAEGDISETDVEQFLPVEESSTRLYFYIGKNMWHPDSIEQKAWSRGKPDSFIEENKNDNSKYILKRYPLSKFNNEEGIMTCLKDFKKFAEQNDVEYFSGVTI